MHMEGLSTPFCQKITKQFLSLVGFMYVDDMDLIRIRDNMSRESLTEDLQLALDYWNKLVKVTGGALEPKKSGWYAFGQTWDINTGRYRYQDLGSTGEITAKDKDNNRVSLPFISCHTSQEMIGIKMTPTGDSNDQIASMLAKSKEEGQYIKRGNISPIETMHAIKTSVIPRLSWPLSCMSITKEEGKRLLRPVLQSSLPKLGIVSTLGYDFIHGSSECQGLGIPDLYHLTYARQLEILIDHLWKSTQTGHFIVMAIEEFLLEAGTTFQPFAAPRNFHLSSRLSTNNSWIAALHDYTVQSDIRVTLPLTKIHTQRINDSSLMDTLEVISHLSSSELKDINVCRIYKKVFFLSDLFTGDGTKLSAFAWSDKQHSKTSTLPFNQQDYPNRRQWTTWKKAMQILRQSIMSQQTKSLGQWTVDRSSYLGYWDYFFDTHTNQLFHQRLPNKWETFFANDTRTRSISFSTKGQMCSPPNYSPSLCRCTISTSPTVIKLESFMHLHATSLDTDDTQQSPSMSAEYIRSLINLFPDSKWAAQHFESTASLTNLFQDFKMGNALFVGDGSYDDISGFGAGACIAASSDGTEYIIIGGPTPGPKRCQSAYRSEIGTNVGMSILARSLSTATQSCPSVTVSCDNDNALERPFLPRDKISSRHNSADLISLVHDLWTTSELNINTQRVKGHADAYNRSLTILEQLNCIVDTKAKVYLSLHPQHPIQRQGDSPHGMAHISIYGEEITGKVSSSIQSLQALRRSKLAGIRHNQFTNETWTKLDHCAIARSSSLMSTSKKIFITKWASKQLPVGSVLLKRRHQVSDTCPMCKTAKEDMTHLKSCPSPLSLEIYATGLEQLSTWMTKSQTDPTLQHHILSVLSLRRSQPSAPRLPYPCDRITPNHYNAFIAQEQIGWNQFSEGLISPEWANLQHKYYKSINSRRNGKVWASNLITQLWDLNFHIWTSRNTQLHSNSSFLNQLHGQGIIDIAIEQEFSQGQGCLPHTFSPFFSQNSLEQLKTSMLESKLKWFRTICTAREDNGSDILEDEFTTNMALRRWVGLRPR